MINCLQNINLYLNELKISTTSKKPVLVLFINVLDLKTASPPGFQTKMLSLSVMARIQRNKTSINLLLKQLDQFVCEMEMKERDFMGE